jgi:hypothetical protein
MNLSEFGKAFLLLALRINKHKGSYVDFYFGPRKLRKIVDRESVVSPKKLLTECKILQKKLFLQGYNKDRENYIEKLLLAMRTTIDILNDINIPIKQQFLRFYDIELEPVDESELDKLKEKVKSAYGGSGSLEEQLNELRLRRAVPKAEVFVLFNKALKIVELRTNEIFKDLLPRKEKIFINLIKDDNSDNLKWAYYNWYLGNFQSRIDVNPNFNLYWTTLLTAAAHEGYPGHHTEFSVKERKLYRELNQFEHSVLLLNSPKLIISEGIAELATNMLFSYQAQAEIGLREFCSDTSKEDTLDVLALQNEIKGKMHIYSYNLAYHALIDEWSKKKLIQYARNFEIFNEKSLKNQLKMISDLVHSTTIFSYNLGSSLIINKYGNFPSVRNFRNLLINPILPSDLV